MVTTVTNHTQSAPKTMYKQPYLQKYAGRATRFTCPACKTPHSFTRYLNGETHQPIHPTVGKCNREIKCGYHYTPRQYFADLRNQDLHLPNSHPHKQPTGSNPLHPYPTPSEIILQPQPNQPEKPADFIRHKYLKRSLSLQSNFVLFLRKYFTDVQIAEAANNYLLGATRNKEVIFWQVDIHGKVRTGKIMQYNPQTGRRIKTGYGGINWVHNKLKKSNPAYTHFNLSQCYFGEHLLRLYPDKPVAIVEAEKTAVIASMIIPNYNWLAAGNLNGLTVEKSRALRDRTVILYPDAGCYNHWLRKAEQINQQLSLRLTVSNFPENFATPQQIHDGYDLADYILEQLKYTK